MFGSCPVSLFSSPASSPTPMMVPIASKKPDSSTVKTNRQPVSGPTSLKPPKRLMWPISPKSGAPTILCGMSGTARPHAASGIVTRALMMIATTAMVTMPMRIAPLVLRTVSTNISIRPRTNTSTGHP